MVNKFLSDLGSWLDNFGAKTLKTNGHKMRLVAHAVQVEPVSTPEFPANREINREFCKIRLLSAILPADTRANSEACGKIPYSTEQGIFANEQGICTREQGI